MTMIIEKNSNLYFKFRLGPYNYSVLSLADALTVTVRDEVNQVYLSEFIRLHP